MKANPKRKEAILLMKRINPLNLTLMLGAFISHSAPNERIVNALLKWDSAIGEIWI